MATAEQVATVLAYEFLRRGNFSAASGPVEVLQLANAIVAAGADGDATAVDYESDTPAHLPIWPSKP